LVFRVGREGPPHPLPHHHHVDNQPHADKRMAFTRRRRGRAVLCVDVLLIR